MIPSLPAVRAYRHFFTLSYCIMESELIPQASIHSVKHNITAQPRCQSSASRQQSVCWVSTNKHLHSRVYTEYMCACTVSWQRNALKRAAEGLTIVSVKGWFSNEETPGQLRRIYWEKSHGETAGCKRRRTGGLERGYVERKKSSDESNEWNFPSLQKAADIWPTHLSRSSFEVLFQHAQLHDITRVPDDCHYGNRVTALDVAVETLHAVETERTRHPQPRLHTQRTTQHKPDTWDR